MGCEVNMLNTQYKSFKKNEDGTMVIGFSVTLAVLLLGAGIAIDYACIVNQKDDLQAYADAAVLAAALSGEKNQSELLSIAEATVAGQADHNPQVSLNIIDGEIPSVRVTVTSTHDPLILGAFAYDAFNLEAISESPIARAKKLNLALVLDTTLSMEGTRIEALKSVSSELLENIENSAAEPEDVKVSLVPFADYVKIDMSNRGQPWLNIQPDHVATWTRIDEDASTNCREVGSGELAKTECDIEVLEELTANITWNGCMASRKNGDHRRPEYAGERMQGNAGRTQCSGRYNQMEPLSSDLDSIDTAIQGLGTEGRTYLPAGLIWGWRTLDRNLPFDEAVTTPAEETRDVLLLMTDGENSVGLNGERDDFDGIYHYGGSGSSNEAFFKNQADTLTAELCEGAKANGIEIITVAFEVTEQETLDLLTNCASTPADYYNAQGSDALRAAFQTIGAGFAEVRLSR